MVQSPKGSATASERPNPSHIENVQQLNIYLDEAGSGGIGGGGGTGQGLKFPKPLTWLNDTSKASFPAMTIVAFCEEYQLGEEIQRRLENNGFDEADDLLHADEFDLKDAGFKVGHIAELKWALKKIALESLGRIEAPKREGARRVDIAGGEGGAGGFGGQKGGSGGLGEAPQFDMRFVHRFGVIAGGVGGAGGAGGAAGRGENFRTNDSHQAATGNATMDESNFGPGSLLRGGTGGAGGPGDAAGGVGGLGEAAKLAIQQVDVFGKIVGKLGNVRYRGGSLILSSLTSQGGLGGAGGAGNKQGGNGGTGQGNTFAKPLLSIDEDTRRWIPTTTLKDFGIKEKHLKLLHEQGFQTRGGLFEASKTDLEHFKLGDIYQLTAALNRLIAKKPNAYKMS
ncbi:hypothetical protein B0H11DRAFT_1928400 [Mycena galericulata]|nr:hypothetical protein B0H11DRAFT_1928400 [Mycena galericulata]